MAAILVVLSEHHARATQRLGDDCLALGDDDLAASAPGTFDSVRDTLAHAVVGGRLSGPPHRRAAPVLGGYRRPGRTSPVAASRTCGNGRTAAASG